MSTRICTIGCIDLYERELKNLVEGGIIDDSIIGCFCEIQNQRFAQEAKRFLFVQPACVSLIQYSTPEQIRNFFETYRWKDYMGVFLPVSNLSQGPCGHWSFVLFDGKHTFRYFDSLGELNLPYAKELVRKFCVAFCIRNYKMLIGFSPKQKNSVDCGVYVMALTDKIATHKSMRAEVLSEVTPIYATKFREVLGQYLSTPNFASWEAALHEIEKRSNEASKAEITPA